MDASKAAELLGTLKARFEKYPKRHQGITWPPVEARLKSSPKALDALLRMEESGGEPDLIAYDKASERYAYCDCSAESPSGRRSLCYDQVALDSRKENKPAGSAVGMALAMGIELLDEEAYRTLQGLGKFDLKTSSWVRTPEGVRSLGGALFCDRRYERVFIYHNGADSYYAARGFRGRLSL